MPSAFLVILLLKKFKTLSYACLSPFLNKLLLASCKPKNLEVRSLLKSSLNCLYSSSASLKTLLPSVFFPNAFLRTFNNSSRTLIRGPRSLPLFAASVIKLLILDKSLS